MTANSNPPDDSADALRARALQRAHEEDKASKHEKSARLFRQAALTPGIDIELAHELRVHQIELTMQNEELRESKLALEISRARYFDLYELAPVGYLTVSEAGLILDCNLTAATMLRMPRGRLKTKAFGQLLAKQDQDAWYLLRRKLAATDEHINAELRLVRGDGSQLWCMLGVANSTDELGVTATRVVISDLTERKAAEELLRSSDAALEAISQGVIVTTPDLLIGSVNAAFMAITGYSEADALGRNCRFMQGPDSDRNTVAAIRTALQQRTEFDGEILNYRKDGTPFWNELTISPVLDGQGVLTHFVGITRDITARKRAEDALRESESRYRTLVEHSPYCIHEIDLEGRFTAMNHAGLKMMGVNDVCFIKEMPYLDVVGDCDRERITGLLANALAGQSSEFDFQTGNGMAVHSTLVPITDEKGVVQRLMGLSIDITERQRLETQLIASMKDASNLRAALDEHAIVAITDVHGRITFANDKFCAISQYSREELLGKDHRLVSSGRHSKAFIQDLWTTIKSGRAWQGELNNRAKDGSYYWVDTTIMPFVDEHGEVREFVAIRRDITDRKLAEVAMAQMTLMLEHTGSLAKVGGWAVDIATQKLSWTAQTFRIAERDSPIEPPLEEGINLFAPPARPIIAAAVQAAMDDGRPYDLELPIVTEKGEQRWVQTQGFAESLNGKPVRLYGTFQDITQRKLAEQAQNTLLKDKLALLKEVHHRVKNNLQVITSLLRLEASRSEMNETKSVLTLMQGRIHAMAQLHETLYRSGTFAEIDLGSYLGTLCTQIFSMHLLRQGSVKLKLDMASVKVNMDQATSCGLLLNELVSNCLKHAFPDDRTGEVIVTLQPLQPITHVNGALWRLRVQDTGVGLPGNFEEKRKSSLGLQLVGDLSLQAGGDLVIESEPGKGTVFTVDFEALLPAALEMPS